MSKLKNAAYFHFRQRLTDRNYQNKCSGVVNMQYSGQNKISANRNAEHSEVTRRPSNSLFTTSFGYEKIALSQSTNLILLEENILRSMIILYSALEFLVFFHCVLSFPSRFHAKKTDWRYRL